MTTEVLTGRALDAAVAEKVMGFAHVRDNVGNRVCPSVPAYSTTWEGAGMVVEAMRAKGYEFEVGDHMVTFALKRWIYHPYDDGNTPQAVCHAALLAVEAGG